MIAKFGYITETPPTESVWSALLIVKTVHLDSFFPNGKDSTQDLEHAK